MHSICFLADASSIHTQRWVNYFAENGWKVNLITWRSADKSKIHSRVTLHRLISPPHYLTRYTALIEIMIMIKRIKPDIIHAHYVNVFGVLAGLYARVTGFKPIVLTAWGYNSFKNLKGLQKVLVKYSLNKSDFITCDGVNTKKILMKELGISSKKIVLIYHGVDTKIFTLEQKNKELRKELELLDSPTIISIRQLEPIYDVESLIKSIPLVLNKLPKSKFVIAGKGSQEAYLRRLTKSLEVDGNVNFVGQILHDELPKYLASSDVYVSTSLSDGGIAVSTLEAMACELAPVVTAVGDNRKWIKDGENGFVVPIKNPEALAEKIIYLLENEDIRKKFGKINRKIIEEKQNYYEEMEKMENIYKELIERYKS